MQLRKSTYKGKIMDSSTQTVPDQNMGIRELVDRHTRGVPLGVNQKQGEYFDTEIPVYEDLTDMLEHKKELQGKLREYNAKIKLQKAEMEKKIEDKLVEENVLSKKSQEKVTTKE